MIYIIKKKKEREIYIKKSFRKIQTGLELDCLSPLPPHHKKELKGGQRFMME